MPPNAPKVVTSKPDRERGERPPEKPRDSAIVHLQLTSAKPQEPAAVTAYEDTSAFVARPLEIAPADSAPLEPAEYNPDITSPHVGETLTPGGHVAPAEKATSNAQTYARRVFELLREFSAKSKSGEWLWSTNTLCFWCCHGFSSVPIGLPIRYDGTHYQVTGCFCSIACAAAHNIESPSNNATVCERHALLCSLADDIGFEGDVRAAPPRETLCCFGGYMSIEQFRAFSATDQVVVSNTPPMKSLTQQVEEVNLTEVGSGYRFIPIDRVRSERGLAASGYSLARPRAPQDVRSTLHQSMNLQITKRANKASA